MADEHHTGGGAPGEVTVVVVTDRHGRFVDQLLGTPAALTTPALNAPRFRDEDPEWALTRLRIRAEHFGRDARCDRIVADAVRPQLPALARRGARAHPPRRRPHG